VVHADDSIRLNVLELFSGGVGALGNMTETQNRETLEGADGWNRTLAVRCTQGLTAVLALTHPDKGDIWFANLGGNPSTGWSATVINSAHSGSDPVELRRIQNEHLGETDCLKNERVVGFLAPTRGMWCLINRRSELSTILHHSAVGDTWLKLPAIYTHRVFALLGRVFTAQDGYAGHIRTPP
jgi:pyruvate dehydrogenase phosphatase